VALPDLRLYSYFLFSVFCFRLVVALPGHLGFEVRGSKFGVDHERSEYNPTPTPPSGRSGGTLDIPWTHRTPSRS
jgi:hypothetical protein